MTKDQILTRYREALLDASVMLENITRNWNDPPLARARNQYIALGRSIHQLLATTSTTFGDPQP